MPTEGGYACIEWTPGSNIDASTVRFRTPNGGSADNFDLDDLRLCTRADS